MYRPKIEQLFFSKCPRGMMFSPKEWFLVDKWEAAGIPYEVVEKGINLTFQQLRVVNRRVNLAECDSQVQKLWQWHKDNRPVAAARQSKTSADIGEKAFAQEKLQEIIDSVNQTPNRERFAEIYGRMISSLVKIKEEINSVGKVSSLDIEKDVDDIFKAGWEAVKAMLPAEMLAEAKVLVEKDLAKAKKGMSAKAYQETIAAVLDEELRELVGFKKLNLFRLKL